MEAFKSSRSHSEDNISDLDSVYSEADDSSSLLCVYKKISDRVSHLTTEAKQLRQTVVADLGKDFTDMEATLQKSEKEMRHVRETTRQVCRELEVESYVEDMIKRLETYGQGLRRVVYHVDDVYQKVFVSDVKKKGKFKSPPTPLGLDLKGMGAISGQKGASREVGKYVPVASKSDTFAHDDSMLSLKSLMSGGKEPPKPLACFDKVERERAQKTSEKIWMERYGGIREEEVQEESDDFEVD